MSRLEYTSEHRQFREMVHDFVLQTVVRRTSGGRRPGWTVRCHRSRQAWAAGVFGSRGIRSARC